MPSHAPATGMTNSTASSFPISITTLLHLTTMTTIQTIRNAGPEYLSLTSIVDDTSWCGSALPQIHQKLQQAQAASDRTQAEIRAFDDKSKYQLSRFNKLKHNGVKKAWYRSTGKLEEKLREEEVQWLKRFEEVQAAKARGEEQDKEVQELRASYRRCREAKETHDRAKRDLEQLIERLFAGPTPHFPREDELEQNLALGKQRLLEGQRVLKRQEYIRDMLAVAQKCLAASMAELQTSLQMNMYDIFSSNAYADIAVHSSLARARDFASKAQFYVSEVRKVDRYVPQLGNLQIEQDNFVFNIIFDNIFTDLRVRQIISESYAKIDRANKILVTNVLPDVVNKFNLLQTQEVLLRTEVATLEKEHWDECVRIMSEVVGREVPRTYDAPPTAPPRSVVESIPEDENSDEPPPPYSLTNNP
jgi:hypothetical protein